MDAWTLRKTEIINLILKCSFRAKTCKSRISSVHNIFILLFRNWLHQTAHRRILPALTNPNWSSLSDEVDFLSALQSSLAQDGAKQLDAYLSCSADCMDLLKSFPAVCKLSVKLNTPLPASAVCERLFSIAWLASSSRRIRLLSWHFGNKLLLRIKRHF